MPAIFSEKGIAECRLTLQLATSTTSFFEFRKNDIEHFVLAVWSKYERQIMSTYAVQVRVIGITNIDALNNLIGCPTFEGREINIPTTCQ